MTNKALIVWCDDVLVAAVAATHRVASPTAISRTKGWLLLGLAWRPEIADKT